MTSTYKFRVSPINQTPQVTQIFSTIPKISFLSKYFLDFLQKTASANPAPPVVARNSFILGSLAWNAYAASSSKTLIDNFPVISLNVTNVPAFLNQAILASWSLYYSSYLSYNITGLTQISNEVIGDFGSKGLPYTDESEAVSQFMSAVTTYLSGRDADGWKLAGTIIGTLPNQGQNISINSPLSSLNDYDSWTPIGTQNYLLPEWGRVRGLISSSSFSSIVSLTEAMFYPSSAQKSAETQALLTTSTTLTDTQKMIAEFWKGGSSTITPPGFFIFFAVFSALSKNIGIEEECRLYKCLCGSLFQASIVAWKIKRDKVQSRPIQNIKHISPATNVANWSSVTPISTEIWKAYQDITPPEANTPPHPDFVSGHSTFSAAGATVLSLFFGDTSASSVSFSDQYLPLLSPIFSSSGNNCLTNIYSILPGTSGIETGKPTNCVTLSYSTWDEMAREAGVSRVYGGIHIESSNQGGLYAGRQIAINLYNNL